MALDMHKAAELVWGIPNPRKYKERKDATNFIRGAISYGPPYHIGQTVWYYMTMQHDDFYVGSWVQVTVEGFHRRNRYPDDQKDLDWLYVIGANDTQLHDVTPNLLAAERPEEGIVPEKMPTPTIIPNFDFQINTAEARRD